MARITYRKGRKGETIDIRADKGEDLRNVVAEMARPVEEMARPVEGTRPSYPHTLTPEQFAIILVALDGARAREAAYVAKHDDRPDDHLKALDELRKLWAFSGPIVLAARRSA